jgi:hypothetical protein
MSADVSSGPLHVPFSWLSADLEENAEARFAATVKTVVRGTRTIATIVQSQLIDVDADVQPMLSTNDLDALVGLMVSSLRMLGVLADDRLDRRDAASMEGGGV